MGWDPTNEDQYQNTDQVMYDTDGITPLNVNILMIDPTREDFADCYAEWDFVDEISYRAYEYQSKMIALIEEAISEGLTVAPYSVDYEAYHDAYDGAADDVDALIDAYDGSRSCTGQGRQGLCQRHRGQSTGCHLHADQPRIRRWQHQWLDLHIRQWH